jgi:hypothetical protein
MVEQTRSFELFGFAAFAAATAAGGGCFSVVISAFAGATVACSFARPIAAIAFSDLIRRLLRVLSRRGR